MLKLVVILGVWFLDWVFFYYFGYEVWLGLYDVLVVWGYVYGVVEGCVLGFYIDLGECLWWWFEWEDI